jgi:arylsulfatase A-like enzyme
MPGRTVDGLVESIDLTATMLDIAGAELPRCQGRSLVPFTKGQGAAREMAHSELDLEKDADELHNLVEDPSHAGIREDLHKDYVQPFLATTENPPR